MKIQLKDKPESKKWFAWRPIIIADRIVWLEFVKRIRTGYCSMGGIGHYYTYSLIEKEAQNESN